MSKGLYKLTVHTYIIHTRHSRSLYWIISQSCLSETVPHRQSAESQHVTRVGVEVWFIDAIIWHPETPWTLLQQKLDNLSCHQSIELQRWMSPTTRRLNRDSSRPEQSRPIGRRSNVAGNMKTRVDKDLSAASCHFTCTKCMQMTALHIVRVFNYQHRGVYIM